jgi:Putative restriction endonuclease
MANILAGVAAYETEVRAERAAMSRLGRCRSAMRVPCLGDGQRCKSLRPPERYCVRLIPSGWDFRIEDAVRLADSEPEPDVSVARGDIEDYADRHPGPADLAMVVEVAVSSVSEDRQMVDVYGPAGIPVYWILNLKARQVEVYTLLKRPGVFRYGKPRVFKAGQSVPVVIEGVAVGQIAVADILPRNPSGARPAAGGNGA